MPEMGRPVNAVRNQFKGIGLHQNAQKSQKKKQNMQEMLDKVTGRRPDVIYKKGNGSEIGKDGFLRLLTHQLKNQDPLKPMEQNKFAAELAQFSQLEQLTNMREDLKKLNNNAPAEMKFFAASFLGKNVVSRGSSIKHKGPGATSSIHFNLGQPASRVLVRILDKNNNFIAQIDAENLPAGAQTLQWDGISLDKSYAAKGDYSLAVQAWDNNLNKIEIESRSSGTVSKVAFDNGETVLTVNGNRVFLHDIVSFGVDDQKGAVDTANKAQAVKSYRETLSERRL